MAGSMERSKLHVEGDDDKHSIIHVLIRNGVDYDSRPWPPALPEIEQTGGVEALLEGMRTAISVRGYPVDSGMSSI